MPRLVVQNVCMSITTCAIRLADLAEAGAIATLSRDTIEAGLPWRWQPNDIIRFIRSARHNVIVAEEAGPAPALSPAPAAHADRKSTRLNSSHG